MCHHYDTKELAEWKRLLEEERAEEPSDDEGELAEEDPEPATPPADD